jgi:predicted NBD/HSP70 family sugar kinase
VLSGIKSGKLFNPKTKMNNHSEKLLAIRISAAHFSVCVFDPREKKLIEESYKRIPNAHKATREIASNSWSDLIKSTLIAQPAGVRFCSVSIPGSLISNIGFNREWSFGFDEIGLRSLLAEMLGIPVGNIEVFSNSVSFLRGALVRWRDLANCNLIGIEVGTELGTSLKAGSAIVDLSSPDADLLPQADRCQLTTSWLLKRYSEASGISVMNVCQLDQMYKTHHTVKKVLKEFCSNLGTYLFALQQTHSVDCILLTGEIAFPTDQVVMLQRRCAPARLRVGFRSDFATLAGAGMLYAEKQNNLLSPIHLTTSCHPIPQAQRRQYKQHQKL